MKRLAFLLVSLAFTLSIVLPFATAKTSERPHRRATMKKISKPQRYQTGWGGGEQLYYTIWLGPVRAGRAAFIVGDVDRPSRDSQFWVRAVAETDPGLSSLITAKGELATRLALNGLRPLQAHQKERIGKKQKDIQSTFKRPIEHRIQRGTHAYRSTFHVRQRTDDLSSMLLTLRTLPLRIGMKRTQHVFAGSTLYRTRMQVAGADLVSTDAGTFRCFRVEISGQKLNRVGKVMPNKKPRQVTLWLSADARRLPVKIEASLPLGRVVALLQQHQPAPRRLAAWR